MQVLKLLQLKINTQYISEEHFQLLLHKAEGYVSETDIDGQQTFYIAWFNLKDPSELQPLKTDLEIQAALLGIAPENIEIQPLRDDWESAWQETWQSQAIGKNFCVRPSFRQPLANKVDLILEPGMAFGTGQHPTTRLCLCAIEDLLSQQPITSMLDMGAGSGLLAIAAAKLGVNDIMAVDMEQDSVNACHDNASLNQVQFSAIQDNTPPKRTFELVVANILANPLIHMAEDLSATVEKYLILSGLLHTQVDTLVQAYQAQNLDVEHISHEGEWVAILFKKVSRLT